MIQFLSKFAQEAYVRIIYSTSSVTYFKVKPSFLHNVKHWNAV